MKSMIYFTSLLVGLGYCVKGVAFIEKTIEVQSQGMDKPVPVTLVLPEGYRPDKQYSTIYTLHGWSGNHRNYPEKTPLGELADQYEVIYVSPDGNYDSWYIDSEIKTESKYYSFIVNELVPYIDKHYATKANKENRAITGLSMGGFGALYIGIQNPGVFGQVGSMSGGVSPEHFKGNWGISAVMDKGWENYNISALAHRLIGHKTNLIIDCGVDDFFITSNRALHQKLLDLRIQHTYMEKPGAHSWDYWKDAIRYQTFFFTQHFAG